MPLSMKYTFLSNVPALMIRDFAGKQTCSKLSVNAFNALSETG